MLVEVLEPGFVAQAPEHRDQVVAALRLEDPGVADEGHLLTRRPGCGDEAASLREVGPRVPSVGARTDRVRAVAPVAVEVRRQHLAARPFELRAASDVVHAVSVDGIVDRVPHSHVVERRHPGVEEHVEGLKGRIDMQLARVARSQPGEEVCGRERIQPFDRSSRRRAPRRRSLARTARRCVLATR